MEFLPFLQNSASYVIPFIVVLSIVVFVHEFGHYWVARRCGVRVDAFSIGFGKELFGWTDKHGTRWKIAALPFGGFVKMFGDADETSARPDENVARMTEEEKKVAFYYQNVAKRMAIVAAGPIFNYLFAIVVLAGLFMAVGQPFTPPVVDTLVENSPAAQAGIQLGDRVLKIDGQQVDRFEDIKRMVALNLGHPMAFDVERAGQQLVFTVTPEVVLTTDRLGGEHRLGRIGIVSNAVEFRERGSVSALKEAVLETWNISAGTLKAVGQMLVGLRGAEELGGPIRIAEMSGKVAQEGFGSLLWFLAVISINLGLINLFPIPLLDGGNLMFYGVEVVRRRPLSEAAQETGLKIGLFVVGSLMIFATWNDLVHLRVVSYLRGLFS